MSCLHALCLHLLLFGLRLGLEHHDAVVRRRVVSLRLEIFERPCCEEEGLNLPDLLDEGVEHALLVGEGASEEDGEDDGEGDDEGVSG